MLDLKIIISVKSVAVWRKQAQTNGELGGGNIFFKINKQIQNIVTLISVSYLYSSWKNTGNNHYYPNTEFGSEILNLDIDIIFVSLGIKIWNNSQYCKAREDWI